MDLGKENMFTETTGYIDFRTAYLVWIHLAGGFFAKLPQFQCIKEMREKHGYD